MALGTVDKVLLVISLVASAGIGVYHGVKGLNQTSTDYLLGNRMMKPLPLAMSLTVGTVSAITLMGHAGEMYAHGTQLWIMDIGMALGMFFVAKYFIPIFYPLKMVSLYHYIESRFQSIWLKRATVILTLGGAYLFIGFLLFPPSLFLEIFTGLPMLTNIVITGLVCTIYSSFGGVKAVVYTDVLQSLIMVAGSLSIVWQGAYNVGGLGEAWDIAYHRGRIEFFNFNFDPYQRHSFWLVIIYGIFFSIGTYGVNQSQTQRTFSTASVKEAQRVIYYAIIGMFILRGLANLSGVVIFANYADCDPVTLSKSKKNLVAVVAYVTQHLTNIPGLAGLFVASIYAAVLSSISTQVNSMTALLWEDFLKGLPVFKTWSEVNITRFQKVLVMVTGVLGIFTGLLASKFDSFLESLFKIVGAVWGPMVGLFLVALYLPWVKQKGATLGFVIAIFVSIWIVIGQITTQPDDLPMLPVSIEGCPASLLGRSNETPTTNQTEGIASPDYRSQNNETLSDMSNEVLEIPTNVSNSNTSLQINRGVGFYGISYCLNYCWGVITCITVSILFTVFTSSNTPSDVDSSLIHPCAWKCFTKGFKATLRDLFHCLFRSEGVEGNKSRELGVDPSKYEEELEPMGKTT